MSGSAFCGCMNFFSVINFSKSQTNRNCEFLVFPFNLYSDLHNFGTTLLERQEEWSGLQEFYHPHQEKIHNQAVKEPSHFSEPEQGI